MTDEYHRTATLQALREAASQHGIQTAGADLIRLGTNAVWSLPCGVVARVHSIRSADRIGLELALADHLNANGIPAVQPLPGVGLVTTTVAPVTFWRKLDILRPATTREVGLALRALHDLQPPSWLPAMDPFRDVMSKLPYLGLDPQDLLWLVERMQHLLRPWGLMHRDGPDAVPLALCHGDAQPHNLAVTAQGALVWMDLENAGVAAPQYDLAGVAALRTTFGLLRGEQWDAFNAAYGGDDILLWPPHQLLLSVWELRMAVFALGYAKFHPDAREQAQYRLQCIQGMHGRRPWAWTELG